MRIMSLMLLWAFLSGTRCFSQALACDQNTFRTEVLKRNARGKLYKYVCSGIEGKELTEIMFLGVVVSKGEALKIVRTTWIWGSSQRATNRILIYNAANKLLGNYYVGMLDDLPDGIEENQLIFSNDKNGACDGNVVTKIDFTDGIPAGIFVRCNGDSGDFYSFSTGE